MSGDMSCSHGRPALSADQETLIVSLLRDAQATPELIKENPEVPPAVIDFTLKEEFVIKHGKNVVCEEIVHAILSQSVSTLLLGDLSSSLSLFKHYLFLTSCLTHGTPAVLSALHDPNNSGGSSIETMVRALHRVRASKTALCSLLHEAVSCACLADGAPGIGADDGCCGRGDVK
eukprot:TRINITY_DN15329_c0_g1_i1.p1 TRINITY_DN15329_c0_g1~~TRINITY_DN15329_c0_g1_i1.p1  ORF type:complete len:198 (-),score=36.28 TRINITY_DN15329_c0_g1_i1:164-688(-)